MLLLQHRLFLQFLCSFMPEGGNENLSVKQMLTFLLAVSVDSVNKVEVGQNKAAVHPGLNITAEAKVHV